YLIRLVGGDSATASEETKAAPEIDTDPTGRVYLSNAPTRRSETRLIASALLDRGVPLCEEALSDDRQFMDDAITKVLRSPGTAGGLLALTRDAVLARSVTSVELPPMLERANKGNAFFVVAAQFSDFNPGDVAVQLRSQGTSIKTISKKKAGPAEAAEIARLVLDRRIAAIHKSLPPSEPLRLELYTKVQPAFKQGTALLIDWVERFTPKVASRETWDKCLLPALQDIVRAIERNATGRAILADGRPSLPAAIALGCGFIQPKDIKIQWAQHTLGRPDQLWSIDARREESGLERKTTAQHPGARDLAVLVSVTSNVEQVFEATLDLPPFRAITRAWKSPFGIEAIANAAQAADAAFKVRDAVRDAMANYPNLGTIHLFMAVPAGLAMMIGQLLNVLGPVQTYDMEFGDAGRRYRAAALLTPSESTR
ncbi:MAG: SAVED domain-containing protein, partial [Blastocatellia bacterium]